MTSHLTKVNPKLAGPLLIGQGAAFKRLKLFPIISKEAMVEPQLREQWIDLGLVAVSRKISFTSENWQLAGCLAPWFDGAILSRAWKGRPTAQARHGSATPTLILRAAIQPSQASLAQPSRDFGIDPKTVEDLETGPKI